MKGKPLTGTLHLIRLFLVVFAGAFVVIGGAQFLKGHTLHYAGAQGLLWGAISAAVFVIAHHYRLRNGQHCAACEIAPAGPNFASSTQQDRSMAPEDVEPPPSAR